jgi:hypothetical protein
LSQAPQRICFFFEDFPEEGTWKIHNHLKWFLVIGGEVSEGVDFCADFSEYLHPTSPLCGLCGLFSEASFLTKRDILAKIAVIWVGGLCYGEGEGKGKGGGAFQGTGSVAV